MKVVTPHFIKEETMAQRKHSIPVKSGKHSSTGEVSPGDSLPVSQLDQQAPGSGREPGSKIKVESDWGKHSTLTSGTHTNGGLGELEGLGGWEQIQEKTETEMERDRDRGKKHVHAAPNSSE